MRRELSKDEWSMLAKADPYLFYRCTTELMGEPANPPYRPVIDDSIQHQDIRHKVSYIRGDLS